MVSRGTRSGPVVAVSFEELNPGSASKKSPIVSCSTHNHERWERSSHLKKNPVSDSQMVPGFAGRSRSAFHGLATEHYFTAVRRVQTPNCLASSKQQPLYKMSPPVVRTQQTRPGERSYQHLSTLSRSSLLVEVHISQRSIM